LKVYLNGKIISLNKAHISPVDEGYLYSRGAFETFRSVNGKLPFFNMHYARLKKALGYLNIRITESGHTLNKTIKKLLKENNLKDTYIRITVSAGTENRPTVFIYTKPLPVIPEKYMKNGIKISVSNVSRTRFSEIPKHKTINCLENIYERNLAMEKGFLNALILDETKNYAVECVSANIFMVKNGILYTPALSDFPMLPGITRALVIKLSKKLKIPLQEKKVTLKELTKADEVFITGSLYGLVPVNCIDKHNIGAPGKITKRLMVEYFKLSNFLIE